jgi:hypothetical protein
VSGSSPIRSRMSCGMVTCPLLVIFMVRPARVKYYQ